MYAQHQIDTHSISMTRMYAQFFVHSLTHTHTHTHTEFTHTNT